MTKLYRRLGALTVLGVTAGVSMLAGSILLGTASADEPANVLSAPDTKAAFTFAYAGHAGPGAGGDLLAPSCVISYRAWSAEDGELPKLDGIEALPAFAISAIAPGDIDEAIASGKIKLLEPGETEDFTISLGEGGFTAGKRIEIRPGEEPKVFEFKAGELPEGAVAGTLFSAKAGELPEGFTPPDPANCTVIGEDGMTTPDGTKVKPAASVTLP